MTHDWHLTPEARWRATQAARDAEDPWCDHSRTLVRNPDGTLSQGPPKSQPVTPARISDADYDKLTYPERIAYAAQFAQK